MAMSELPLSRRDFQRLADLRAKEARILARSGCEQGAYYLAGYAVECALKACIAKKTRRHDFPPKKSYVDKVYRHDLETLFKLADLDEQRDEEMKRSEAFRLNWFVVKDWNEEKRYETSGLKGKALYEAVAGADGVLQWIKQRW